MFNHITIIYEIYHIIILIFYSLYFSVQRLGRIIEMPEDFCFKKNLKILSG
ncbi:hypothetical protein HMPREF1145_1322 [Oribacterium parvum ACB8]|nr:hypothetical protein HMPREF1145_1322 [Oribacterium parvum ACB8]